MLVLQLRKRSQFQSIFWKNKTKKQFKQWNVSTCSSANRKHFLFCLWFDVSFVLQKIQQYWNNQRENQHTYNKVYKNIFMNYFFACCVLRYRCFWLSLLMSAWPFKYSETETTIKPQSSKIGRIWISLEKWLKTGRGRMISTLFFMLAKLSITPWTGDLGN